MRHWEIGRRSRLAALAAAVLALAATLAVTAPAAPAKKKPRSFGVRALKVGASGKDVAVLQKYLTKLGIPTSRDGAYGPETKRNVKALERNRRWKVNGWVSRKDAKRIRKLAKRGRLIATGPRGRYFYYGPLNPGATLTGTAPGTVRIDVVNTSGAAIASIPVTLSQSETGFAGSFIWYGLTSSNLAAADGAYGFAIGDDGGTGATITSGTVSTFDYRRNIFPIRKAAFSYGGAGSRFGASRGDHIHQGQDLSAPCGARLAAVEGGRVLVRAYQAGGAGYYVVIRGVVSGRDYVYMHLKGPGPLKVGQTLLTTATVGKVGSTGSSTGCHLHFEAWTKPGWYNGGKPIDPLPLLQYWDSFS